MRVKTEAELLRQVPLFAGADQAHLQIIAFASSPVDVTAGNHLCRAGEGREAAFLILLGEADILDADGKVIGEAIQGAFIGEQSLLTGEPVTVTIRARRATLRAIRIERSLIMRVAREFPEFARSLARSVAARLDATLRDLAGVKELFG